jgi:hypothetical protein
MEVTINCPFGHSDCEWCNEARHNFEKAVEAVDPYRTPPLKDEYGRPLMHTVGMPGCRGKRGGIE